MTVRAMLERSSTPCRSCRQLEQSRLRNALDALAQMVGGPSSTERAISSCSRSVNLLMGLSAPIDWWSVNPYAMHRKAYERTGEEIERVRMLRHVTAEEHEG